MKRIRIFVASNGLSAHKFINSLNKKKFLFYAMVTQEDLLSNYSYINWFTKFEIVESGESEKNFGNVPLILELSKKYDCDFVYVGYGHASENPVLSYKLANKFLGPNFVSMAFLTDKLISNVIAEILGIPIPKYFSNFNTQMIKNEFYKVKKFYETNELTDLPVLEIFDENLKLKKDLIFSNSKKNDFSKLENTDFLNKQVNLDFVKNIFNTEGSINHEFIDLKFPVMFKIANSGGGRGISLINNKDELIDKIKSTNVNYLITELITQSRHIEVQVLADKFKNILILGGRECTNQRRNQKLIETSLIFDSKFTKNIFKSMCKNAIKLIKSVGYYGLATVEYIFKDGLYYFLEVNCRIQVEHTITELVYNLNLPNLLVKIFLNEKLNFKIQKKNNFVIGVRITAENDDFIPSIGKLQVTDNSKNCFTYFSTYSGVLNEYCDSHFGYIFSFSNNFKTTKQNLLNDLNSLIIKGIQTPLKKLIEFIKQNKINKSVEELNSFRIERSIELIEPIIILYIKLRNRNVKFLSENEIVSVIVYEYEDLLVVEQPNTQLGFNNNADNNSKNMDIEKCSFDGNSKYFYCKFKEIDEKIILFYENETKLLEYNYSDGILYYNDNYFYTNFDTFKSEFTGTIIDIYNSEILIESMKTKIYIKVPLNSEILVKKNQLIKKGGDLYTLINYKTKEFTIPTNNLDCDFVLFAIQNFYVKKEFLKFKNEPIFYLKNLLNHPNCKLEIVKYVISNAITLNVEVDLDLYVRLLEKYGFNYDLRNLKYKKSNCVKQNILEKEIVFVEGDLKEVFYENYALIMKLSKPILTFISKPDKVNTCQVDMKSCDIKSKINSSKNMNSVVKSNESTEDKLEISVHSDILELRFYRNNELIEYSVNLIQQKNIKNSFENYNFDGLMKFYLQENDIKFSIQEIFLVQTSVTSAEDNKYNETKNTTGDFNNQETKNSKNPGIYDLSEIIYVDNKEKYSLTFNKSTNLSIRGFILSIYNSCVIFIINNKLILNGSFGIKEDIHFYLLSLLSRKNKFPKIFISNNSGARIGLVNNLLENTTLIDDCIYTKNTTNVLKKDNKIISIYGNEDTGPENLSYCSLIAKESVMCYENTLTISYIQKMAVGIGSYLSKLSYRIIQNSNSFVILTGYKALNKIYKSNLYNSNLELGGEQVFKDNCMIDQTVVNDFEGVEQILFWCEVFIKRRLNCKNTKTNNIFDPSKSNTDLVTNLDSDFSDYCASDLIEKCDPKNFTNFDELLKFNIANTNDIYCSLINERYNELEIINLILDRYKEYSNEFGTDIRVIRGFVNERSLGLISSKYSIFTHKNVERIADSIEKFNYENIDLLILTNWEGFSGTKEELQNNIISWGAKLISNLVHFNQRILIYLPPFSVLRGGSYVVFDQLINQNIKMFVHPTSQISILDPAGVGEVKLKCVNKKELLFCEKHDSSYRMVRNRKVSGWLLVNQLKCAVESMLFDENW